MGVFKNRSGNVRPGWKIAAVLIIFFVLTIASGAFLGLAVLIAGVFRIPGILNVTEGAISLSFNGFADSGVFVMVSTFLQALSMAVAVKIGLRAFDGKKFRDIGLGSLRGRLRELAFGMLIGAVSMSIIYAILVMEGSISVKKADSSGLTLTVVTSLITYILVAINEELFSRGYCISVLRQSGGTWLPFIISSVLFALMHSLNPNLSLIGMLNLFLVGMLLALMYHKTGSLWMPIGYHFTWNWFQGTVFGFPVSGMNIGGIMAAEIVENNILNGGAFGPEGGILATAAVIGVCALFLPKRPATNLSSQAGGGRA